MVPLFSSSILSLFLVVCSFVYMGMTLNALDAWLSSCEAVA